jgi:large subunit ribosomal protein L6
MSRIGRKPIALPATVQLRQEEATVVVEGPKGRLSHRLPPGISVRLDGQQALIERAGDAPALKALHGLTRALIANMVHGAVSGYAKELEIVGVGYRAQAQGQTLTLSVGLSHPVTVTIPEGITVELPKPTVIAVKGADKYLVGQFAATIRRIAPPEPYRGKGIRYAGETIRRKAGKAATGAGAAKAGAG